jgi:hypothetical protein
MPKEIFPKIKLKTNKQNLANYYDQFKILILK